LIVCCTSFLKAMGICLFLFISQITINLH
jgi:hypothetical protein